MDAFFIILTGVLVGLTCGLLGCFLVLRKMAMTGDAISHAVLPGIVIAYLLSGSLQSLPVMIGAAAFGMITTLLIEFFHKKARLQSDAAIGVVFTGLFAIGVILLSAFSKNVDLDQECVLYGEIAYVPLDLWILPDGRHMGPRAIWLLCFTLLMILLYIGTGYRALLSTTFDPGFSTAIGWSNASWHYSLMALVSLATVTAFESVGAILVVAFLVIPPAIAYLFAGSLIQMLLLILPLSILISAGGYYFASAVDGSIAGAMTVVAGVLFIIAFLVSPKSGFYRQMTFFNKTNPINQSNEKPI